MQPGRFDRAINLPNTRHHELVPLEVDLRSSSVTPGNQSRRQV
jgi:hypothetical protein